MVENYSLDITTLDDSKDPNQCQSIIWTNKHGIKTQQKKLGQLERLRIRTTFLTSWLPILLSRIGSQVKRTQSQSYIFKEFAKITNFWILKQTLHETHLTFWSCLIRCANMKWMPWVLLKIQSGHDSVHRRTDRQTDKAKPVYHSFNFVEAVGKMRNWSNSSKHALIISKCLQGPDQYNYIKDDVLTAAYCGKNMILWPSYLHNASTGKMTLFFIESGPGGQFKIKMPSYQYRKSHYGDKAILRLSYLHNGISYTGKMTPSYWIVPWGLFLVLP